MPTRSAWFNRACLLVAVLFMVQSAFIVVQSYTEWRQQFSRNFSGYKALEDAEFASLEANHTEVPIPLTIEKSELDGSQTLHFSLTGESAVYLSVSADSAQTVFVHPMILQREDGRRFLLPLIRSQTPGNRIWNSINLGRYSSGEHTVTLAQDSAAILSLPDSLQFRASRPNQDSQLAVFIDHSPVVKLKDIGNVLDDIPLIGYSGITKRGSQYLVTSHLIFSSENGGTMPMALMRKTQRTLDIEWVMKQVFKVDDDGSLEASYRLFQERRHGKEKFAGKERLGNNPVLSVATSNNNFGDGQIHIGRWTIPSPFIDRNEDPIYYAPKPIFLPPNDGWQKLVEGIPELQTWSQFEVALEGCVDLGNSAEPYALTFLDDLEFVRQHMQVSYPDRGCREHRLSLSNLWVAYPIERLGVP